MSPARIGIVGGGPGGLSTAMILSAKGFNVTLFEKSPTIGGRTSSLQVGHSKFDLGPTFLMMKFVLDKVFQDSGKKSEHYMKFQRLDPMYRLQFNKDTHMDCYDFSQRDKMLQELKRVVPEDVEGYQRWSEWETKRYERLIPLLQKAYSSHSDVVCMDALKALPYMQFQKSLHHMLSDFYQNPLSKLSFSFQAKYLGMSPFTCPAYYGIIPFVEHAFGVYHVEGGLSEIPRTMAVAASENGAHIKLGTPVKQLIIDQNSRQVKGVKVMEEGKEENEYYFDEVILNADFPYAVHHLIPNAENLLRQWKPSKIVKKKFSCSTFMMYLALDKEYPEIQHHTISFADDYSANLKAISEGYITDDLSIYVRNSCVNDKTVSPKGKSGLYVLVPIPNLIDSQGKIDWTNPTTIQKTRELVLKHLETRVGFEDLRNHIEAEKIITPIEWQSQHNVFNGSVFSLSHNLLQMLSMRPRNKFNELEGLYLTGAHTSPGSGLPTIFESGRMVSEMLCQKYGIPYTRSSLLESM
ncbi:hypothetical protein FDP41_003223 [Naegleria fowleri]|uniref:Amine oxidase domain-containing protein n=1 Tax=Naegleria fowleri TaxID=5763 RepID=A0A6A5BU42_NAEFO|nr:uncharacterized protein FDP41_003223 [Naegleria fowleri]KAF0977901.1 hypothetical protein FDP41_003223 [Naegleria fowleri]CAG4708676.1 unnamed protein product [Naegleria fowleri]